MLRKKTTVIYNTERLNAEQREFVERHQGNPEDVCFDFSDRFIGFEITRKLVRQVRKRQRQRTAA